MENILEALEELPKIFGMFFNSRITRALIIIFAFIISINILTKKLIPYCIKHTSIPYYQTFTYYLIHKSKFIHFLKPLGFIFIELSPILVCLSSFVALSIISASFFNHIHCSFLNKDHIIAAIICSIILILANTIISTLYLHWITYLFKRTALLHRIKIIYQYPWWLFMNISEIILAIMAIIMFFTSKSYAITMFGVATIFFIYNKYVKRKMNYKTDMDKIFNIINKKASFVFVCIMIVILLYLNFI